ncbi:hypothetical protein [Candidatus Phycosocius spiralis]|uniref:Flagellar protein FlaG n=1 Tax=Candidatus Phycosocius spiralis TaxID=2815099 RepID=A0ABQ4PZK3_9PROT|nr:hypothetical protein [Candidatus Phycosocius spiralis]GIU68118.1 hypothetical protein PsB1_2272 [Candidatus Phycosocius spiralis]
MATFTLNHMNMEIKNVLPLQVPPVAPIRPGQEVTVKPAQNSVETQSENNGPRQKVFFSNSNFDKARPYDASISSNDATDAKSNEARIAMVEQVLGINKSLLIERNKNAPGFIYKSIDRKTGEITRIWPLEVMAETLADLTDAQTRPSMRGMMVDAKA